MRASPPEDASSSRAELQVAFVRPDSLSRSFLTAAARTGVCVGPFVHHASPVLQAAGFRVLFESSRTASPGMDQVARRTDRVLSVAMWQRCVDTVAECAIIQRWTKSPVPE